MENAPISAERLPLEVRRMRFPFDDTIPRHWFGGNRVATQLANAVNLLFPVGERGFVRAVRAHAHLVTDPDLQAQLKGFYGQEGAHAHEHERFFAIMEAQGFEIRGFLERYEKILNAMDARSSAELRLAITAALEHFTAILAEGALTRNVFENAHPVMRELLTWHAAEEIEHKAVAFDVLQIANPSYALRMRGLTVATLGLGAFWFAAVLMLLRQENMSLVEIYKELLLARNKDDSIIRRVFLAGIRDYVRRDFHPNQRDNRGPARDFLNGVKERNAAA